MSEAVERLRIAIVAPLIAPIAAPQIGGAQVVLADLASALAERGHQVTLLAAEGSRLDGVELVTFPVDPAARPTDFAALERGNSGTGGRRVGGAAGPGETGRRDDGAAGRAGDASTTVAGMERSFFAGGEALLRAFGRLVDRAGEIDVVHAHAYDWPAFAFAELLPAPVLHTVHLQAIVPPITELLRSIFSGRRHAWYATVSRTCAATYPPPVAFDRVVYNGIRIEDVPFGAQGRGYLLFVGRIAPEKGLADAIEVARRLGRPLQVAGGIYDRDYYDLVLAPHLTTPWLRYHGAVERSRLYELMAGADALLMPVQWDEALGMVTIEAQAAGTPVVAYRRGGLVEVVNDGETGRLATDLDGLVNGTKEATQLNRVACRENVAAQFTLDRMVDEYERLYREMLLR